MKPAVEGGKPVRTDFLVFGQPCIGAEEIEEVTNTIKSGWLGTGKKTNRFEKEFAEYQEMPHALGLSSCTSGLFLALRVLNLPVGSEVISTDFTFTATIASIIHNGLVPVLVDCQPKTQNIECNRIEEKITPKTKALVIVAFAGLPCEMDHIIDIAKRYGLYIILDNAHAIESEYNNKRLAHYGDISCYSFYSTKNIVTGEGGMVCSHDKKYIDDMRVLSLHGMSATAYTRFSDSGFKLYDVMHAGYKMNMTDIEASLGIHQLARVEENWKKRQNIWKQYKDGLSDLPVYLPIDIPENMKHAYHLFTMQLKLDQFKVNRDYILHALTQEGIGVGVHYTAIHGFSYYANTYGYREKDFPNSQWLSERTISLPLSPALKKEDIEDVIEACTKVLEYYKR